MGALCRIFAPKVRPTHLPVSGLRFACWRSECSCCPPGLGPPRAMSVCPPRCPRRRAVFRFAPRGQTRLSGARAAGGAPCVGGVLPPAGGAWGSLGPLANLPSLWSWASRVPANSAPINSRNEHPPGRVPGAGSGRRGGGPPLCGRGSAPARGRPRMAAIVVPRASRAALAAVPRAPSGLCVAAPRGPSPACAAPRPQNSGRRPPAQAPLRRPPAPGPAWRSRPGVVGDRLPRVGSGSVAGCPPSARLGRAPYQSAPKPTDRLGNRRRRVVRASSFRRPSPGVLASAPLAGSVSSLGIPQNPCAAGVFASSATPGSQKSGGFLLRWSAVGMRLVCRRSVKAIPLLVRRSAFALFLNVVLVEVQINGLLNQLVDLVAQFYGDLPQVFGRLPGEPDMELVQLYVGFYAQRPRPLCKSPIG